MKLKYLFSSVLASALLFAGCDKNLNDSFDNIKLSQTYLSIPENGGNAEVTITAAEDWQFVTTESWPEVVKFAKGADGKAYKAKYDRFGFLSNPESEIESKTPSWLKVNVLKGGNGETKVVFSADETSGGREIEIAIKAGENTKQFIKVRQGAMGSVSATCKDIIGGADGKTYTVEGTCTGIANDVYGNWYLNDGTGEIYIYGTLDKNGAEKNFTSLGIEVGDVVSVTGPKTTYNSTVELVNVTVNKITKSLVKVITEEKLIVKEGADFDVVLSYKGTGVNPTVPAEYRSWVSIVDMKSKKGVPTKIEQNPADTAIVTLHVPANEGGLREASVDFTCGTTTVHYAFKQDGSIIETTADKINAAADGSTLYRYTGYITRDTGNDYGNIYIKDATGEVYCYGVLNDKGEAKKWKEMGISEGDIVTVVGPKTSYNNNPQLKNVSVEKHIKVSDISIAAFSKLDDDKNTWYRISGKVGKSTEAGTKYDLATYGNFALFDGADEIYVYGVKAGWGGAKGEFGKLGVKEGDNLTIVCYKTSYNGLNEADGCFYVSHEAGQAENPGDDDNSDDDKDPYTSNVEFKIVENAYTDGVATVNDTENVATLKIGKSSAVGTGSIVLPKGTKAVTYYAVAWKGTSATLKFMIGDKEIGTQEIAANNGASGNAPYTMTVTASDKYTLTFDSALEAETEVSVTTTAAARAILFGVKAK